ncbi:MAG: hypothetical protein EKK48_24690 [Candidatus Melainabacteria bacterium]|nr:MAG: hypothetical protein EKK48_24690 [Candidatus Melainabacteria bacterium]
MRKNRVRSSHGSQLAEFPAAIILLLLGVAFPIIIMASIFYKVYMFECIVKNGAQLGSEMPDLATATTAASNYCTTHKPAGVSCATPVVSFVQRTVTYTSSGAPKTYPAYFLQVTDTGSVSPLVQMHDLFGLQVPGLTGPITLQATQAVYFENQTAAAAASGGS